MFISLSDSRSNGFKKWSDQHPHNGGNDDDQLGAANPIAVGGLTDRRLGVGRGFIGGTKLISEHAGAGQ
jgi:hypothetical protein